MEQRSPEWFAARAGRITSSKMSCVTARKNTNKYKDYMQEIVYDLMGIPRFDEDKPWHEHGKKYEPMAYNIYIHMNYMEKAGFILHPKYTFIGCSPDGYFKGDHVSVGLEIKCRSSRKSHEQERGGNIKGLWADQIQTCLWITGAKWWDFMSFLVIENEQGGMEETDHYIVRVLPNHDRWKLFEKRCKEFYIEAWNTAKEEMS